MRYTRQYKRVLAVSSYKASNISLKAAAKAFKAHCKSMKLDPPADVEGYIRRWHRYYEKKGHVEGDSQSSGRKPKITKSAAAQLVADLRNWADFGLTGPFASIKELQETSPTARAILQEANAAVSTIIRAVQACEPSMQFELLAAKQKLTEQQMAARVRTALQHITISDQQLELVVWIDAKTMYMVLRARKGWVIHGEAVPIQTTRPASKKNPIMLKYYIGVCARTGAVFLRFYTGTTGMKADRNPSRPYLVSHVMCSLHSSLLTAAASACWMPALQRSRRPVGSLGLSQTT
jgi:transposase